MSRLVAPHVTNQIWITFEIQAKKDEIHAKMTYEIQRRMLKSKQRRISKTFEIHKVHQPKVPQPKVPQPKVPQPKVHQPNPNKEGYEIQTKKDFVIHANKYP